MPTQTFWNLPAEKREALVAVAVEEFANNDYNSASISRIVAQAGIAKGSIYQYFADKQELFLYLLELSNQKRLAFVQAEAPPASRMGFWALLRWQVGASTRAAMAYPLLTRLFYRAMQGSLPFRDAVAQQTEAIAREQWRGLLQRGVAEGAIDPQVDLDLAAAMMGAVFNAVGPHLMGRLGLADAPLHELDAAAFQRPEVEAVFDEVIAILERGLGAR